jgi:uncharacterized protein YqhQ
LAQKPLTIGGQAIIEGVMMRGPNGYAMSVRRADGSIRTESTPHHPLTVRKPWLNLPILRGAVGLVEMMTIGMKALEFSAQEAERGEAAKEAAAKGLDLPHDDSPEKPISKWALALTLTFSLVVGLVMFNVLPNLATAFIAFLTGTGDRVLLEEHHPIVYNLISGVIRLIIIVGYIWAISLMNDVKRLFQYHGAEHKVVSAFESGKELTVAHAQSFTTLHPRCGTTFIALTMMVAIFVFAFFAYALMWVWPEFGNIPFWPRKAILILGHIAVMPLVAGVCFEVLRLGGRYRNNLFLKAIITPGYWFQRLTTSNPDDSMVEVAIRSLESALALPVPALAEATVKGVAPTRSDEMPEEAAAVG